MDFNIATMTFHWATNYGAVIQAYALQKCIEKLGYKTEIIDYVPRRIKLINIIVLLRSRNSVMRIKEKNIEKFRGRYLRLSDTRFPSSKSLKSSSELYSHIFVGSDQIWNHSFTMGAEGKPTLSYFLDFAGKRTKKISYAASFGMDVALDDYVNLVKPYIKQFAAVSVRESTGVQICKQLGVSAELVCDPTVLLERSDYEALLAESDRHNKEYIYSYLLHGKEDAAKGIIQKAKAEINVTDEVTDKGEGIEVWIDNIKNAKFVVTNSFHGMMFCIIFNTPFIVIPVKGSKMNNRISTVLTLLGLMDRIVDSADSIPNNDIDWNYVNSKLEEERNIGVAFIQRNIC